MKSFLTVLVVPSAMISKKDAHSPQLKPSANNDVLYGNLWGLEEGSCLGPDGFIEWERVGKEAIRSTICG
jgi:hypothetical protein